jgi:hypothetical protein
MRGHFNVAPRYTPGSPAMVPEDLARRVAEEEKKFIQHALEGAWGEEQKQRAERLGLRGIVEMRIERRDHWEVEDLCTGEKFKRFFPEKLRKLGWTPFEDMPPWAKKQIPASFTDIEKFDRLFFKVGSIVQGPQGFPMQEIKMYRPWETDRIEI